MVEEELPDLVESLSRDALIALVRVLQGTIRDQQKIIEAQQKRIEELEAKVEALEGRLNQPPKGPHNSSVPPSAGFKANVLDKKGGKGHRRRKEAHHQGGRKLCANPDEVRQFHATGCPCCQTAIAPANQTCVARYDKIEIPQIKPKVTRVEVFEGRCLACQKKVRPEVPAELVNDGLTGPNLRTLIVHLQQHQLMSYERLRLFLKDLLGIDLSEGGIANAIFQVYKKCEGAVQAIGRAVRGSPVIHSDETGARVNGKTHWEFALVSKTAVLHDIGPGRNYARLQSLMQGAKPKVWSSDLFGAQLKQPADERQTCLAHQLRDLTFAVEAGDTAFAPNMRLLFEAVFEFKDKEWLKDPALAKELREVLETRTRELLALQTDHPEAKKLQKRYAKHLSSLFTCLTHPGVKPTNNVAEQALRPSVIKRKVSSFRSIKGAKAYAASRSIIATGRLLNLTPLSSLRSAVSGGFIPLLTGG